MVYGFREWCLSPLPYPLEKTEEEVMTNPTSERDDKPLESDYRMDEIINLVNDLLGEGYSIKNIIKHIKDAV